VSWPRRRLECRPQRGLLRRSPGTCLRGTDNPNDQEGWPPRIPGPRDRRVTTALIGGGGGFLSGRGEKALKETLSKEQIVATRALILSPGYLVNYAGPAALDSGAKAARAAAATAAATSLGENVRAVASED
jgi:hypothetical protein